jgi:hypothetical protein
MGFCNYVLYKIWAFHIGFVEDTSCLGCVAVSLSWCFLMFQRNMLPASSRVKRCCYSTGSGGCSTSVE